MPSSTHVSTRTPGPSGGRKRAIRPGRRQEVARRVLGVDPDLDRVAATRRAAGHRQRLAGRDPQLLADDVDPGAELGDRMLDLEPRVQLDERERAVGAEQELERARVRVADRAAGALGGGLHRLAQLRVERRRRRLLDELLVAALDRALALAERQHAALRVAEHLHLDVARRDERLLEVEVAVAERGLRLGGRGLEGVVELGRVGDEPHPLAAAAGRRLQQHRVAELGGRGPRLGERRRAVGAGDERHVGGAQLVLGERLVAHPLHHLGARPDEDEVVAPRTRATKAGFSERKP